LGVLEESPRRKKKKGGTGILRKRAKKLVGETPSLLKGEKEGKKKGKRFHKEGGSSTKKKKAGREKNLRERGGEDLEEPGIWWGEKERGHNKVQKDKLQKTRKKGFHQTTSTIQSNRRGGRSWKKRKFAPTR